MVVQVVVGLAEIQHSAPNLNLQVDRKYSSSKSFTRYLMVEVVLIKWTSSWIQDHLGGGGATAVGGCGQTRLQLVDLVEQEQQVQLMEHQQQELVVVVEVVKCVLGPGGAGPGGGTGGLGGGHQV